MLCKQNGRKLYCERYIYKSKVCKRCFNFSPGTYYEYFYTEDENSDEDSDEPNYQFALSCTKHLTKEFCIGAETGLNSFAHFFIYQVPDPLGNLENYNGRYEINQAYLAFVPEYRPFPWLYLNGGLGVFADVRSRFTQGYARSGQQERPLRGTEFRRGNPLGGFLGFGLNPRIYRNMSLVLEGRMVACPATRKLEYITAIGYGAGQINLGLHFMLDEKKK